MLNHEISLRKGCVYHCRIVDGYDVWKEHISTYDMLNYSFTYEHVNDLITGLFFLAKDKGIRVSKQPFSTTYQQDWGDRHRPPKDVVSSLCSTYDPHELRQNLWDLFHTDAASNSPKLSKAKRKKMISLFESLTDLVTAAFYLQTGPILEICK